MQEKIEVRFSDMQNRCTENKKLLQCNPEYLENEILAYQESKDEKDKHIKYAENLLIRLRNQFLGINWKDFCYTYAATTSFILSCFFLNEQTARNYNLSHYLIDPETFSKITTICVFSLISTCINNIAMENLGRKWSAAGTVATCSTAYFLPSEIREQLVFCMIIAFPFALMFCKSHNRKKLLQDYITVLECTKALECDTSLIKTFHTLAYPDANKRQELRSTEQSVVRKGLFKMSGSMLCNFPFGEQIYRASSGNALSAIDSVALVLAGQNQKSISQE